MELATVYSPPYRDLIIIYPKPYPIHLSGTIVTPDTWMNDADNFEEYTAKGDDNYSVP